MWPVILAAASLAVTAYSTDQQIKASKQAQAFREKQAREEQKRANIQAIRSMREQVRAQRVEAARVANTAASTGTSNSSGAAGAIAGSGTDLASNLSYGAQMQQIDTSVGSAGVGAARASTQGQIWGAYGNLAGTVFQGVGGFSAFRQQ